MVSPGPILKGRKILLGVCGGIACYKSVALARGLTQLGAEVRVILTQSAQEFLRPLVFEGVTGIPALTSLWSAEGAARHLELAASADLVVVAPATADFLSRAAHGRADDLLGAVLLATRAPVLVAPAMNTRMWEHPQVQANARHVQDALGMVQIGPVSGPLGVGESAGMGRMVEPDELLAHASRVLLGRPAWSKRRVVVTAGPTREPLDPVRYLGNRSSGRMGYALAREAWVRGAEVTLVSGPVTVPPPVGVEVVRVESAVEMLEALRPRVEDADLLIFAAAVADYRATHVLDQKRKREKDGAWLPVLEPNPDLAVETLAMGGRAFRLGFALETGDLISEARRKMERKGFDWVMANAPIRGISGFEAETNEGYLLSREAPDHPVAIRRAPKEQVAAHLLDAVQQRWERA
jgi:phosphopantothenoylcysteine decarboxylase / phosphopantothenate---cysteine ligase